MSTTHQRPVHLAFSASSRKGRYTACDMQVRVVGRVSLERQDVTCVWCQKALAKLDKRRAA